MAAYPLRIGNGELWIMSGSLDYPSEDTSKPLVTNTNKTQNNTRLG